jgi:hypothetical protein
MARFAGSCFTSRFAERLVCCGCAVGLVVAVLFCPIHASELPRPKTSANKSDASGERYRWLFGEQPEQSSVEALHHSGLKALDREIKRARQVYISGAPEEALKAYTTAIESLESLLDQTPPGHPLLSEISRRLSVFEETAAKILGPIKLDPGPGVAPAVFEILERRRACRLRIVVKQCGPVHFHDMPASILDEEARLLDQITKHADLSVGKARSSEESKIRTRLADVRNALQKGSRGFPLIRGDYGVPLDVLRNEVLSQDEVLVDFNLFRDRMVVGVISKEEARYHHFETNRADMDKGIMLLQSRLREFTAGEKASFMGHAWKEPCRRVHRILLGRLTSLSMDKKKVLVIPDGSLWYLPFSLLLDAEDRPFGTDRLISLLPSAASLRFLRSAPVEPSGAARKPELLMFESVHHASASTSVGASQEDRPHQTESSLKNPVYSKPTPAAVKIHEVFDKAEVFIGPAATVERFRQAGQRKRDVTVLALPVAVTDEILGAVQPCMFFSPPKERGPRRLLVSELFQIRLDSGLTMLPSAWIEPADKETPSADGPFLMSIALMYSGTRLAMVNYSQVGWGEPEPFLMSLFKQSAEKAPIADAIAQYPKTMPIGVDSSFSGRPPDWAGWILMGDPGR